MNNLPIPIVCMIFALGISYLIKSDTLHNTYTLKESCDSGTISITLTPRDSTQSITYQTTSECE